MLDIEEHLLSLGGFSLELFTCFSESEKLEEVSNELELELETLSCGLFCSSLSLSEVYFNNLV